MNFTQIKLILKQPLPIILKKVRTVIYEEILHKRLSYNHSSNDYRKDISSKQLFFKTGIVDLKKIQTDYINTEVQEYLTNMYSNHRFDLLGTGWVKNSYHSTPIGIEGIKFENTLEHLIIDEKGNWLNEIVHQNHLNFSKLIWQQIIKTNTNYTPIDWQKDYKSGFRFNAKIPYINQTKLIHSKGIDLKMPWELSRLQHLPQLAIFAKNNEDAKESIIKEFKCQLLDFIMTNPIGMGVNWSCTMDVGIRAANICIALDWFLQIDTKNILNDWFVDIVKNYIHQHGKHIFSNFEYKEGLTSNHYLGNIAGLSFVSSYLEGNQELDFWLGYSIQELKNELPKQFFNDGSNFEGSTAYHRLSGEMMIYCFSILNSISTKRLEKISSIPTKHFFIKSAYKKLISKEIITQDVADSFYKMAQFSLAYRKPNGNIVQVGDNDSGRFFKFTPCGDFLPLQDVFKKYLTYKENDDYTEDKFWDENNINHDSFIAALSGFFNETSLQEFSENYKVEYQFINQLVKPFKTPLKSTPEPSNNSYNLDLPYKKTFTKELIVDLENLSIKCFPDFGFIAVSTDKFYFSISFGANLQSHHSWGHQHNDKLAIELQFNGIDIFVDPGTYIYTPLPEKRNLFRSTFAHNTIHIKNIEQNSLAHARGSLFNVAKNTSIKIIKISVTHIIVQADYFDIQHIREIIISTNDITINDYCNRDFEQDFNNKYFSNGYGKLISN